MRPTPLALVPDELDDEPEPYGLDAWFEWSNDGLVLTDDDGVIVDANDAACDVLGLARDEIVGETLSGFRAPRWELYGRADDREYVDDLAEGEIVHDERLAEHGDGTVRLLELVGIPDLFGEGVHLSIVRDKTAGTRRHGAKGKASVRLAAGTDVVARGARARR